MSKYFTISRGVRGYAPQASRVVRVDTRRDLRAEIELEAGFADSGMIVGLTARKISHLAAWSWYVARSKSEIFKTDFELPYRKSYQRRCEFAITCAVALRAEFLAQERKP